METWQPSFSLAADRNARDTALSSGHLRPPKLPMSGLSDRRRCPNSSSFVSMDGECRMCFRKIIVFSRQT